MTYLVIGANGFLGSYIVEELKKRGDIIIATARSIDKNEDDDHVTWIACDVRDRKQVSSLMLRMKTHSEYNVIYLAAFHNPDEVQNNPRLAWDTNITALSAFMNQTDGVKSFFYSSTDTVYGEGNKDCRFKEQNTVNPVNLYGKHKALAEQLVLTYGYNVVRFPFLIGPSLAKTKKHFYDSIRETIQSGKKIEMFYDSYRSTLSFRQAAMYLIMLIERYNEMTPKVINIASDDSFSKYDIALMIAEQYRINSSLIIPISIQDNHVFKVPRAGTTLMDNSLLKQVLQLDYVHLEL